MKFWPLASNRLRTTVAISGYTTIKSSQTAPGRRNSSDPRCLRNPPPPAGLLTVGRISPAGAEGAGSEVGTATATSGPHHSAGDATSTDPRPQPRITHWDENRSDGVAFRVQVEYTGALRTDRRGPGRGLDLRGATLCPRA